HTTSGQAARNMVVAGLGIGLMMQVFVLSVQNAVPVASIGIATALTQFSRSIGSTLGVTLMGVIVNQRLPAAARGRGAVLHRLPPRAREQLASALHPAFLSAVFVCVIVLALVVFYVKEVPLRRGFEEPAAGADEIGEGGVASTRRAMPSCGSTAGMTASCTLGTRSRPPTTTSTRWAARVLLTP